MSLPLTCTACCRPSSPPRRRKILRRRPPAGRHAGGGQQNIRALEEKLALRLFQRNTHNVLLTDEGKALLAQVAPLWQALAATLESAGGERQAPAGVVRVTMIPASAARC